MPSILNECKLINVSTKCDDEPPEGDLLLLFYKYNRELRRKGLFEDSRDGLYPSGNRFCSVLYVPERNLSMFQPQSGTNKVNRGHLTQYWQYFHNIKKSIIPGPQAAYGYEEQFLNAHSDGPHIIVCHHQCFKYC